MDYSISSDDNVRYDIRINFLSARLYRQNLCSDMIKDMQALDYDDVDEEEKEKMLGIIWAHCKSRNSQTPDFITWRKKQKRIDLVVLCQVIRSLWMIASAPTIEVPDNNEERERVGSELSWLFYRYLARKMKIPMEELDYMTPGELFDIYYFEEKMSAMTDNPEYMATQDDYTSFFE